MGAAILAGACGSSVPAAGTTPASLPNLAQVQAGIAATILKFDHVKAQVYCPSVVPQIPGETFSCVAVAKRPTVQTFIFQATVHSGTFVSWARTG